MLSYCPSCGYDLAGLRADRTLHCPECGGGLDEPAVREHARRRAGRLCGVALLCPVITLPLCLFGGPLIFILVWPLTAYLFYRSIRLGGVAQGTRPPHPMGTLITALLAALGWTFVVLSGLAVFFAGVQGLLA